MKHIVIFRTSGSYLDVKSYNCQELGLSKALVSKGYKVSLIMAGPKTEHVHFAYRSKVIDIYYLKYKSIHQSMALFAGWKTLLKSIQPDVIQIHDLGIVMSYMVSLWAKQNHIRCVLVQGNYETTKKSVFKQLELCFNAVFGRCVLRNVDAIGCKTLDAGNYIARYSDKKTILTPIGLDDDRFAGCKCENDFRKEHKLEEKKVLLYIGRMEQRRNPLFLLQLMESMPDDYELVLIGDGPQMIDVVDYVKNHHLNNVLVLGKKQQEELPAIYAAADLFLLASDYEIYGMVILESMYFGTPVISTSTAGGKTIIENGVDGIVIDGLEDSKWTKYIKDICGNKDKLSNMSIAAKRKIQEHLVWDKAADNFVQLYENCD